MAAVEKTASGRWRVRWRTSPGGPQRAKVFDRKADAERYGAGVEHHKATGEYVDSAAGRITFADYAEGWLQRKRQALKTSTTDTFQSQLRKHLLPEFGDVPLRSITLERVKGWAGTLSPPLAPTTARAVVYTLAAILREAIDDGRIARNPAERIQIGTRTDRQVDPRHVAAVADKVQAIADAMPARYRAAVLLMASVGLRLGECCGITVDRVDWLRHTIRIDRQMSTTTAGTGFTTPKTRAGRRTIPVPGEVVELLAAHLAEFPAGDHGLIFTHPDGGPVKRGRWADAYRIAIEVAGAPTGTRTHDLRHVAASSLIAGGLSVAAVQAVLGHATPSETLDVYTHLWPTDEDRTRIAIEASARAWL